MSRVTYRALLAAAIIFVISAGLAVRGGRQNAPVTRFSSELFGTFDTLVTFTAFAENESEFEMYAEIFREEMTRLHKLFDIYGNYDGVVNLKSINDAAGTEPLRVDPSITELLEIARDVYEDTGGAVNAALGPVLAIWRGYRHKGEDAVPSAGELRAAAKHVSPEDILIDREHSAVLLRHEDMRLDVGAMAKGYAARKTIERLREAGLRSGLINAGGDVAIAGPPLDGRPAWNIGLHAPSAGHDLSKLMDVLELSGGAAVTSGSDQRYYTAGGKRYHHIIDPETLFPAEGVESVTVLHPDAALADALSTAAFIMPAGKAEELLRKKGAEAFWTLTDGTERATEGYLRFSKNLKSRLNGKQEK